MRHSTIIPAALLCAALAAGADSDRPSPFGPKPNGRTYEKTHPRPAAPAAPTAPAAEQQRARSAPASPAGGAVETGPATYSGSDLDGRPTASGDAFDSRSLTAAHPTLPIGSYVRITNVSTGKSIVVRINDRCRASSSRVIQLTKRGAEDLGMGSGAGTLTVKVEPVKAEGRE
jgi:rare lipoprotein A